MFYVPGLGLLYVPGLGLLYVPGFGFILKKSQIYSGLVFFDGTPKNCETTGQPYLWQQ